MACPWRKWRVSTVCNCEGFSAGCAHIGDKVWRVLRGSPTRIVAIGSFLWTSNN